MASKTRSSNWNVPNVLTVARMLATPLFVWLLLADAGAMGGLRWAAACFFAIAIASDALDGHLARSRGLVTDLGKLLDPIADKALTGGAFVALSLLGELPWWVTIVLLVREISITVHRLIEARVVVLAAAWMGKLKTVVQALAIMLALIPPVFEQLSVGVNTTVMTAAVCLTLASGADYVLHVLRLRGRRELRHGAGGEQTR